MGLWLRNTGEFLRKDVKLSIRNNFVIAILFLLCIPGIRGVSNLDEMQAAECLEQFLVIIGIILITPINRLEFETEIRELIFSKERSYTAVNFFRIVISCCLTAVLITMFVIFLKSNNCIFPFWKYTVSSILASCFLGLFGLLLSQIGQNAAVGYLGALGYYSLNKMQMVSKDFPFYLFQLEKGSSFVEIIILWGILNTALFIMILFILSRRTAIG